MKIYQKFLLKRYIKNFLILFLALSLFFTGIDLMQNFKSLPHSANLQIIYTVNKFMSFVSYTLPLSLVFAMFNTIFSLIKSSELVAIYALGVSKWKIIQPIFLLSILLTLGYILLGFTSFAQADDRAENIRKYGTISIATNNIFIKSHNDYVAIQALTPLKKEATGVKIFRTKAGHLDEVISAKHAHFINNQWNLESVTQTKLQKPDTEAGKLQIKHLTTYSALHDFNPDVLTNLFKGTGKLNIRDTLLAMKLSDREGMDGGSIRAHLYILILFPLFAPIVILGLFFPLPLQRRGSNLALLSSLYIFGSLLIWGIIFTMSRIATNGALSPEAGILLPLILLLLGALYLMKRYR